MHLYLKYAETVIEIMFPTSETLKLVSEQIFNLEQTLQRRLDVTVAYTELEANDTKYRYKSVEDAIAHLEKFVAQSYALKLSAIDKLAKALDRYDFKHRKSEDKIAFNDRFANLDYSFSIKINDDGKSVEVCYDCESLDDLRFRIYDSIEDCIDDLLKLKELDNQFKTLVADAPFNLDLSKTTEE